MSGLTQRTGDVPPVRAATTCDSDTTPPVRAATTCDSDTTPPPAPDPGAEFLASFDAFAQAVRRARGNTQAARDGALTLSQYSILQALTTRDHARVSDLAAEAGVAASTVTRILDALERRAIVKRTRSREDRRGVTVTLTDSGREALHAQDAWMRSRQLAFFDGLPGVERELAPDLLLRLASLIDELATGPGPA
jgi:DNA-binding MarR family transcriptional regulator